MRYPLPEKTTGGVSDCYEENGIPLPCWRCGRIVAKIREFYGSIQIKCNKCKGVNQYDIPDNRPAPAARVDVDEILSILDSRWDAQRLAHATRRAEIAPRKRFLIFMRDGFRCAYCGRSPREHGIVLHVDHQVPKSKGGLDEDENLVTACADCNLGKSDIELSS